MREHIEKGCKHHGVTTHRNYANDGRWRCLKCEAARKKKHRHNIRNILINEFGGKCQICGYNKFYGALEFHHVDPLTKEFTIASVGWMKGIDRIRKEAQKCVLLCSNCHREVEGGVATLESRLTAGSLTLTQKV